MSSNARFHYSVHFFDENAFIKILKPRDLKDGKAKDIIGKVEKYTCHYGGCTKRKMGYKELCVHLATSHQLLRQVMGEDNRPGMKEVLNMLYPPEDLIPAVKVKQEKGVTPSNPKVYAPISISRSNLELEDSEDVDDPTGPSEQPSRPAPTA